MISENAKYWIWLTIAFGYSSPKIGRIIELYDNISEFYDGGEAEWIFSGVVDRRDIDKLKSADIASAELILQKCLKLKYSVVAIDDEAYPQCLRNIAVPPAVLYVHGTLPDIDNRLTIGVVGTRRATKYGIDNSYKFGYALSKYGATVISGGALGVDCASHRGALAADGVTVCVLGCGINYNYLNENASMRTAITKRGAVISEYPPDEAPRNYHFPARNRIIAALSDGVLVIEAGAKSGSLITADFAIDQGKEVFALLGNNSPQNEGSNIRIKEGSAVPVTDFMDILNYFDNIYITGDNVDFNSLSQEDISAVPVKGRLAPRKAAASRGRQTAVNLKEAEIAAVADEYYEPKVLKPKVHKQNLNLNKTALAVYNYITDEPVHIDKIASSLGIPVYKILIALTTLEMQGLVTALQGRRYILK